MSLIQQSNTLTIKLTRTQYHSSFALQNIQVITSCKVVKTHKTEQIIKLGDTQIHINLEIPVLQPKKQKTQMEIVKVLIFCSKLLNGKTETTQKPNQPISFKECPKPLVQGQPQPYIEPQE